MQLTAVGLPVLLCTCSYILPHAHTFPQPAAVQAMHRMVYWLQSCMMQLMCGPVLCVPPPLPPAALERETCHPSGVAIALQFINTCQP